MSRLLCDYFNLSNYPGTKLVGVAFKLRKRMKNSQLSAHILHRTLNLVISYCCLRGQQRNVPKFKTHVQGNGFCSFNVLFCIVVIAVAIVIQGLSSLLRFGEADSTRKVPCHKQNKAFHSCCPSHFQVLSSEQSSLQYSAIIIICWFLMTFSDQFSSKPLHFGVVHAYRAKINKGVPTPSSLQAPVQEIMCNLVSCPSVLTILFFTISLKLAFKNIVRE